MAMGNNPTQPQEMDPELFEKLDQGLRQVFDLSVANHKRHSKGSHQHVHGIAAANAAEALVELHTRCKPK